MAKDTYPEFAPLQEDELSAMWQFMLNDDHVDVRVCPSDPNELQIHMSLDITHPSHIGTLEELSHCAGFGEPEDIE